MELQRMLILSASFGEGHRQAANAIKELFALKYPNMEIEVVDYIHSLSPKWNRFAQFVYIQGIKHIPKVYGYLYHQINRIPPNSRLHRRLNLIGMIIGRKKLLEYIHQFKPQVVVHTFPTSAGAVSELKREENLNLPSVTVITDYTIHRQWIHENTDLYIVGSTEVRNQLLDEGIEARKIAVTGIPIRQDFFRPINHDQVRAEFQLDQRIPTVLVMGGAFGVSSHITDLCKILFHAKEEIQVLVVCGRNKRLYEHIKELAADAKNRALIFGYVNRMAELMSVSDVMFTKSGGLTTSEGIAVEVPMVFFKPIPGQEMANAQYLQRAGVAVITQNIEQLEMAFRNLLSNPGQLQRMKENFKELKRKTYLSSIEEEIVKLTIGVK